jgi:hypothetical protein
MASTGSSRRKVPFGGHQLAEYTLAAAFVGLGIHLSGRPAVVLLVRLALSRPPNGPVEYAKKSPPEFGM